ncbi:hypothetical protein AMAG_13028 [Allomyces macrogynus ATCC 38327]|uniref:BZIP domain-containing protein n=1 Tax=Allomyces macrogynus (strain ATCC 38327) TaxID=578462 RepID=A0A0L0T0T4_ALLM3|nr:hypothetical protein AMAG_13028 [Allomyces macrogynus ATCC 38327]|eukprot:KNE68371.1 hypothetical protein AMAG_13028 [Allomyces macrogynus ATCC 38327]
MDKISPPSTPVRTAAAQAFGPFEHFDAKAVIDARRAATPSATATETRRAERRARRQDLTQVAIDHLTRLASMPRGADLVPLVWSVAATAVINANTGAGQPFQQVVPVPAPIVKAVSQVMLAAAPVHVEPERNDEPVDAADQLLHDFFSIPDEEVSAERGLGVTRAIVSEQGLGSVALPTPSPSLSPAPRESDDDVLALLDAVAADAARYQDASVDRTCLKHPGTMLWAPLAIADSVGPAPKSTPGDTSMIAAFAEAPSLPPDTASVRDGPRSMPSRMAKSKSKSAAAVPATPIQSAQHDQNPGSSSSAAAASNDETKDLLMIATNSRKTVTTCPLLPDALPYPKGMRKPDDPVMPPRGSARHKRARDGDVSDQDDGGEDEPPLTPKEKVLKERRRRNTMSARVSRARKQAKIDVLEVEGTRLAVELQHAKDRIESLSKMVSCKELVIAHFVCSQEATEVAKKAVLDTAAPNVVAASIAVTLLTRIQALEQFAGHLLLERQASGPVEATAAAAQELQSVVASDLAAPVVATTST